MSVDRPPARWAGTRRPDPRGEGPAERTFYCRSCQLTARGRWVPAGWYLLERAPGGAGRHQRLGLYCSLACLWAAQELLAAGDREYAVRHGLPVDPARDRARLVDVAQTLLHQGATIRQAAEALDVPTSSLRHWLREAGVTLTGEGTWTAPPLAANEPARRAWLSDEIAEGQRRELPAVSIVNELVQRGCLRDLSWADEQSGPGHLPTFTVTVAATGTAADARTWTATGTARSKAGAKAEAAEALLSQLAQP